MTIFTLKISETIKNVFCMRNNYLDLKLTKAILFSNSQIEIQKESTDKEFGEMIAKQSKPAEEHAVTHIALHGMATLHSSTASTCRLWNQAPINMSCFSGQLFCRTTFKFFYHRFSWKGRFPSRRRGLRDSNSEGKVASGPRKMRESSVRWRSTWFKWNYVCSLDETDH